MDKEQYFNTNGFYEPHFFNMQIENFADERLDFNNCSTKQLGVFIHEYTHYLQNITTVSGIRNAIKYYVFLSEMRSNLTKKSNIDLPINEKLFSSSTIASRVRFNTLMGYSKFDFKTSFDRLDTHIQKINAEDEMLNINFYESGERIGHVSFGVLCVKEGMARSIQKLYDDALDQPQYPYHMTEVLVRQYCPVLVGENMKIAALSALALNYENSGLHFFRLLEDFNLVYDKISFRDFIKGELYDRKLIVNGIPGNSIKDLIFSSINELKRVLEQITGQDLIYLNNLIFNLKEIEKAYDLAFYDILIANNLTPIEKLEELKGLYGIPVIQIANGLLVFPVAEENSDNISAESAMLLSMKILVDRLSEFGGRKICRLYRFCSTRDEDITNEFCFDKQWLREDNCLMTGIMNHWGIIDKINS